MSLGEQTPTDFIHISRSRPVATQLERIEQRLDSVLQAIELTTLHNKIHSLAEGQDKLIQSHAALQQQLEKLGAKLTSWLAEEAIAADILRQTRDLQQQRKELLKQLPGLKNWQQKGNAKHDHTSAMRARPAVRMGKRRVGTNRVSK